MLTRKDFLAFLGAATAGGMLAPAAHAQAKGVLKVSFRTAPASLDPAFGANSDEYVASQAIYDNLTRLDESLKPIPSIATAWDSPDGGATWIFKLRQGVRFHHGRELDAEDVVFSIKRVLNPATGSPGRRAIGPIKDVVADDASVVRFTLEGPLADFPAIMAGSFSRIVPRDASANLNQNPVGSGPFKFKAWVPGQHLRLERNDAYWMEGLPKVQEVWLVTFPAQAAEQVAFSSGETQMIWDVPMSLVPIIAKLPNARVEEIPSTAFQPIVMRCDRAPFNDPRVRRAVKHAINREVVMKIVLLGRGVVGQDTPVPLSSAMRADVKAPEYDVAKAKALLKEAGHEAGFSVNLFASNERFGCIETAQVVKPMLEAVGIRVDIKQVPLDRFNIEVWKKESFFVSNWAGRPSTDEQLYPYFHSTGSWNESFYSNPEIDTLLDAARRDLNLDSRKATYAKVQAILASEGPYVVSYFANYASARAKTLRGLPVSPLKWVDFREASLS